MGKENDVVSGGEYGKDDAAKYKDAKTMPLRERVELYTTLQLVGDLTNQRVLDMACGSGWLTRALKNKANAAYVMGTDLSEDMIQLARKEEDGIDYAVEDARKAIATGDFDVVTANWLLVYARNRSELSAMCHGFAGKLKSAVGRLVTLVVQPELFGYKGDLSFMKRYGFEYVLPDVVEEGAPIRIRIFTPSGDLAVEVENYYFSKEAYEEELRKAGFTNIAFHDWKLGPHPSGIDDREFWSDLLTCPVLTVITATKE